MSSFTFDQELKLYVLAHGIRLDSGAERAWTKRFRGPVSLSEYASTSGICVCTASDVWIYAPFIEDFTKGSAARFVSTGEGFGIAWRDVVTPVSVVPVPEYHHTTYNDGGTDYPYTNVGVTHTDRCRISPVEGCAWVCTFCDLPYEKRYRKKPKGELRSVVYLAEDDT